MKHSIRLTKSKKEFEEVLKIRKIVFVKGQKVPVDIEIDGLDDKSKHVIVKYEDKTIGTARIRFFDNKSKIERLAILKKYRGKGLGEREKKKTFQYVINYCKRKKKKINEIVIHAQYYLKNFYLKFGFKARGKKFKEAGIDHIEMYLKF